MSFDVRDYMESNLKRCRPCGSKELTAECPSCGRWGSFYVNAESGSFVCFKCEFRGNGSTGLVSIIEDITWAEARTFIFRRSVKLRRKESMLTLMERIQMIRGHDTPEVPPEQQDYELPQEFIRCYDDASGKWQLPVFLKQRGIKSATAKCWGMGYCRTGRYASRLVIPIVCPSGKSFTARDMTGNSPPKYLNPTGADHRKLLIGWDQIRMTGDLVICEGPLDTVRLYQHRLSALALGGKELSDEQLALLISLPASTIVTVMLDPEEQLAPLKVASRLSLHFTHVYIAKLPDGIDPGDSNSEQAQKAVDGARRWTGGRTERLRVLISNSRKTIDV